MGEKNRIGWCVGQVHLSVKIERERKSDDGSIE